MISDILEYKELSNSEASEKELDLNEVLNEVLQRLEADFNEKKATVFLINQLPKITARERDLVVLFQNIIQNGIKYNESAKPEIEITTVINTNNFSINFKDNGIGVESIYHEKIFQFFKRLHTSEVYSGTGIGLGLSRKIIRTYKGDILIESSANNGSIFKIIFPIEMLIS